MGPKWEETQIQSLGSGTLLLEFGVCSVETGFWSHASRACRRVVGLGFWIWISPSGSWSLDFLILGFGPHAFGGLELVFHGLKSGAWILEQSVFQSLGLAPGS